MWRFICPYSAQRLALNAYFQRPMLCKTFIDYITQEGCKELNFAAVSYPLGTFEKTLTFSITAVRNSKFPINGIILDNFCNSVNWQPMVVGMPA